MVEISKADWKLFRERIGDWQERYMEKLSKEYVKLLTSPGNASDHFWELEKRIKQDKKHTVVVVAMVAQVLAVLIRGMALSIFPVVVLLPKVAPVQTV